MNRLKVFIAFILLICTYNIHAEDSVFAYLTRTQYWINDTVNFKIEPGFSDDVYAAAFEVSYTTDTLEFAGFDTDNENVFVADTYDENGVLTAGYTKKGQALEDVTEYVIFSFKVKKEGTASVKLTNITAVDSVLNQTITEVNTECAVNIVNPVPPAPSSGGISGGGGGSSGKKGSSVSLPKPVVTAPAEIIPEEKSEPASMPFKDIKPDDWSAEYITRLYEKNIISEANYFRPDDKISRAEFIKLVVLAFEIPPVYDSPEFSDCDKSSWYNSYISAASAAGIVTGTGGKVYPDKAISRQDVCVILSRIIDFSDFKEISFTDSGDIGDYAKDAVSELYSAGVISGMPDGGFLPLGNATRAQAAKMICIASEVGK